VTGFKSKRIQEQLARMRERRELNGLTAAQVKAYRTNGVKISVALIGRLRPVSCECGICNKCKRRESMRRWRANRTKRNQDISAVYQHEVHRPMIPIRQYHF
jgi:hypothetical protein